MNSPIDLLIFGASRNTGLLVARYALEQGLTVGAMVRLDSDLNELKKIDISLIEGDAFVQEDCHNAFRHFHPRYVISTLGGKNKQGMRIDAIGNINIIQSAQQIVPDLTRFLLLTSMGCGEQYQQTSEQVKKFLGEALIAKTAAENYLKTTNLHWTIVRPGGLNNEPASGNFSLTVTNLSTINNINSVGYISRQDVAKAVLAALRDEQYMAKIVMVN